MALQHVPAGEVRNVLACAPQVPATPSAALVKTDQFEAIRLNLPAGKKIPVHQVDGPITVQCLEGDTLFYVEGVPKPMKAGDWLHLAGRTKHALEARDDSTLIVTIFFPNSNTDTLSDAEVSKQVQASYERCSQDGALYDAFYDILLSKSDEIAEKFIATDFVKQKQHLKASLLMMIRLGKGEPKARQALKLVGETHSRSQRDIRPEWYELWLESLCAAVRQTDPQYVPKLDSQWRRQLRPGIDLVTAMY